MLNGKNFKIAFERSGIDGPVLKASVKETISANPSFKAAGKVSAKQGLYYRPAQSTNGKGSQAEVTIEYMGESALYKLAALGASTALLTSAILAI